MSDQSLRDALEKLAAKYQREADGEGGTESFRCTSDKLNALLAAHPAEPVGVSDEARTSGLIDCGGTGHEFEAEVADCRTCGSMGVSDEAVQWARLAFYEHPASHGMNSKAQDRAIRAALEAARPFLQPQVVASRDEIGALLRKHTVDGFTPSHSACSCDRKWRTHADYREHLRDAVLALMGGAK